jgi:thiosulfate reductase cytochrome b subunit
MSPGVDSIAPWLGNLFGGRQSARTVHFVCATLVVLFIIVHVALVVLSGFWNNVRSMITGEYEIEAEAEEEPADGSA